MDIGKVTMANDLGLGVNLLQIPKQEPEGCLLLGRAGVGITTFVIQASDVTDANGMLVVMLDMGTGLED